MSLPVKGLSAVCGILESVAINIGVHAHSCPFVKLGLCYNRAGKWV